jgi:A/G-specific adenine glycosylase
MNIETIVTPLLDWFYSQARVLPWRENPTPYRVWISEIMLQQTRVEAVKPYYDRFMQRLERIEDLALIEEQELLKLWEGLGYYNRARNLKKTANIVVDQYHGKLPASYEELQKLPGIGSYTAGAVASIAYKIKAPAVDGNVLRVFSRLLLYEKDVLSQKAKKEIEHLVMEIMPDDPAAFNQALMELGALVCVPNGKPKCEKCPLELLCLAKAEDRMLEYPKKTPKKPRVIENRTILVIKDQNKAAIQKRPEKGLLAGMYEFPSLSGHVSEEEVIEYLKESGIEVIRIQALEKSKHIFSHIEWHMIGYEVRVDELSPLKKTNEQLLFMTSKDTQDHYPIPTAFLAYTKYLNIQLGIYEK